MRALKTTTQLELVVRLNKVFAISGIDTFWLFEHQIKSEKKKTIRYFFTLEVYYLMQLPIKIFSYILLFILLHFAYKDYNVAVEISH